MTPGANCIATDHRRRGWLTLSATSPEIDCKLRIDPLHMTSHWTFGGQTFITPPARRAWRSYKFAPFLFFFFPRVESRRTAHG